MHQRAGAERKFASLLLFYLLEAVVHHRAESLRRHQADPDGQQQGRDDPDRGDKARFAGHVGDATSPTSFENEWDESLPGVGDARKESLRATQLTRLRKRLNARLVQRATLFCTLL